MKRTLLVVSLILGTTTVFAQMTKGPVYKVPFPDAPKVRVDGRVRGTDDALLTLTVLAPEQVGLTTKAQPSLFWFQSKGNPTRFELTITEGAKPQPLLELQFNRIPADGIQRLRLTDHNLTLTPGVEYRWSVAMIVDAENRSKDVVASGGIKRVEPPDSLKKRLNGAKADDLPFIYADEGMWYDSLEALSDLIEKLPATKILHEHRAVYFMQAGLAEAARHELQRAGKTATGSKK
jgi:hypothetical protein